MPSLDSYYQPDFSHRSKPKSPSRSSAPQYDIGLDGVPVVTSGGGGGGLSGRPGWPDAPRPLSREVDTSCLRAAQGRFRKLVVCRLPRERSDDTSTSGTLCSSHGPDL